MFRIRLAPYILPVRNCKPPTPAPCRIQRRILCVKNENPQHSLHPLPHRYVVGQFAEIDTRRNSMSMKKKIVYLASVALLTGAAALAQSSGSAAQSTSDTQAAQGASPAQGDSADRYGNTVAPDGSTKPQDTSTPDKKSDNSQSSTDNGSTAHNKRSSDITPPGDSRDRYGDIIAPDGSVLPAGAN
jgi:hypothetical protein